MERVWTLESERTGFQSLLPLLQATETLASLQTSLSFIFLIYKMETLESKN